MEPELGGTDPAAAASSNAPGKPQVNFPQRPGRGEFKANTPGARYDKNLAAFRARLVAAGKEKMVIRIALARKLLVWLNAKARDARIAFATVT